MRGKFNRVSFTEGLRYRSEGGKGLDLAAVSVLNKTQCGD